MRSIFRKTGLIAAALSAPAAAAASEPAPRHDPLREPRGAESSPRGERQAGVRLICRSLEIAGSESEAVSMVCMTAADWRRGEQ